MSQTHFSGKFPCPIPSLPNWEFLGVGVQESNFFFFYNQMILMMLSWKHLSVFFDCCLNTASDKEFITL